MKYEEITKNNIKEINNKIKEFKQYKPFIIAYKQEHKILGRKYILIDFKSYLCDNYDTNELYIKLHSVNCTISSYRGFDISLHIGDFISIEANSIYIKLKKDNMHYSDHCIFRFFKSQRKINDIDSFVKLLSESIKGNLNIVS